MKEMFGHSYDQVLGLEEALKRTVEGIKKHEIKEEEFTELYSEEEIRADKDAVRQYNQVFLAKDSAGDQRQYQRAAILEYLIFEQSELSEWFGSHATTIKTGQYDDIKNGVDMVVEFEDGDPIEIRSQEEESREETQEPDRLGLAIDITTSPNLGKKFLDLKEAIKARKLAEVKYFKSEKSPPQKLTHLPHVVIAATQETLEKLTQLWVTGDKEGLARHPFQVQALDEIAAQLEKFKEYSKDVLNDKELVATYDHLYQLIDRIRIEKKKELGISEAYDSGLSWIKRDVERQFSGELDLARAKREKDEDPEKKSEELRKRFPHLGKPAA